MSEIVQKHMENMTEELENMSRTKLFTTEESRKVMKKRKEFEYKINGVHKNLQDFKDYILYEEMILRTIKLRRDKLKIGEKKSNLEQKMATRIKTLYHTAITRFSNDLDLYLQFFKFCKQVNYMHAASSVIRILLGHFAESPESWQIASKWYAYDRKDVEKGLKILYKGIALHKDNKLYIDVVKLEIFRVEQKRSGKEANPANVLEDEQRKCGIKIQAYVREAINNIHDYKYFLELLGYLEDYEFTFSAKKLIYDYLQKNHGHEADVKQILEQKGYNSDEQEVEMKNPAEEPEASTSSKN